MSEGDKGSLTDVTGMPPAEVMVRAFAERDATYDGVFFTAVKTTGIFCRPTCHARKPKRENLEFFPTAHEALVHGYRPCRVCHPLSSFGSEPEWISRLLADLHAASRPPLLLSRVPTPLGTMIAAASETKLFLLEFSERRGIEGQMQALRKRTGGAIIAGRTSLHDEVEAQLQAYFGGDLLAFDLPVEHPGTPFQVAVWCSLLSIPYGQTRSYAEQAVLLGRPEATRAVARANGANRIAVVIPCHRVVGKNGALTGYGGGLWRKRRLLELERGIIRF